MTPTQVAEFLERMPEIRSPRNVSVKAKVKDGWAGAGMGLWVLGPAIHIEQWWYPVREFGDDDPSFVKATCIDFDGQELPWDHTDLPTALDVIDFLVAPGCDSDGPCYRCGRKDVPFSVNSEIWNKVNGSPNGILCPACFQVKAKELGIEPPFLRDEYVTQQREQKIKREAFLEADEIVLRMASADQRYAISSEIRKLAEEVKS